MLATPVWRAWWGSTGREVVTEAPKEGGVRPEGCAEEGGGVEARVGSTREGEMGFGKQRRIQRPAIGQAELRGGSAESERFGGATRAKQDPFRGGVNRA